MATVLFKDGNTLTVFNPGKVSLGEDGRLYQLPHRDGVDRFNADDIKAVHYQRQPARPTKARAVTTTEGEY